VIDEKAIELDELAIEILARQQPVARDLRIVVSALRMSASLERMGDIAEHIAQLTRMRFPERAIPKGLKSTFLKMGELDVEVARQLTELLRTRRASARSSSVGSVPPSASPNGVAAEDAASTVNDESTTTTASSMPWSTSRTPSGTSAVSSTRPRSRARSAATITADSDPPTMTPTRRASSASCVESMRSSVGAPRGRHRPQAFPLRDAPVSVHRPGTVR